MIFDGTNGHEAAPPADKPVSFVRSTKRPKAKRYAVIWTRRTCGKVFSDVIWHVLAHSEDEAKVEALKTERPRHELTVKEEA